MKIGVVVGTNEPEVVWNAFRFGVASLKAGHGTRIFLLNKGVEADEIDDEAFNVKEQIKAFLENNGCILACGTCLKSRRKDKVGVCNISTMQELLKLVEESDKLLSF